MGCTSDKGFPLNEKKQIEEEDNLHISIKQEVNNNPPESFEQKTDEVKINIQLKSENEKEEEKLEDDFLEDIDIQEEEYNRILLGGLSPDTEEDFKMNNKDSNNIRNINNKSINKKKRKKPFIISSVEDSDIKKIKIIINANTFREEYTMPIWCQKDSYIKFKVKGKWRIDRLYQFTDSKGLPSNNTGGFGYGALIGRIGNKDKFVVCDDKAVIVKEEGPLHLKQLLPKNMKIEPEGRLEVNVYDGEYMDVEEINKKIGWIENNTLNYEQNNQEENEDNLISLKKRDEKDKKDFEKKLRNNLNNLRMNPLIFYEQYIGKTNKLTQSKKYLEKFQSSHLSVLNPVDEYYNSILNYFKLLEASTIKRDINKYNVIDYLSKLEEEIGCFLMDKYERNIKVKCKLTQKNKPLDVIILCFFDKKYRFYIFNKRSQDLTINVFKNFYKDFSLVVMAFTLEENSDN
mgnify:CR=1 FL=1